MYDDNKIVKDRQRAIRRRIDDHGILIKTIAADGGWENTSSVLSYFPARAEQEPATMSVAALHRLIRTKALPLELLSELLPAGFALVAVPEDMDLDKLAEDFTDFLHEKNAAHHPESPAGRDISDCEREKLSAKVVNLPIKGKVNAA